MFFLQRTISDDILRKFLPLPNGMVMKQLVSPIDEIYVNILYNSVIEHSRILTTTSECGCTVRFLTYILL